MMLDGIRRRIVLLAAVALAVIVAAVWWLAGCSMLPSTMKQTQELRNEIGELRGDLVQRTSQITNDLWPIVVLVVAALLILGGMAVALVLYWIRRNSYLRQKPMYEACRK